MRFIFCSIFLSVSLLNLLTAYGQENVDTQLKSKLPQPLIDPSNSSPVSAQAASLTLKAGKEEKKLSGKVGLKTDNWVFDLKLSGPLSDDETEIQPLTIEGLGKSAVADLGIQYLKWNPKADETKRIPIQKEVNDSMKRPQNTPIKPDEWKQFPEHKKRFDDAIDWGTPWLFGLRSKIGRADFAYADSSFKEIQVQKTNFAWVLYFGALTDAVGYIGINFQTTTSFSGGKKNQYLIPYNSSGVLVSKTLTLGDPKKSIKELYQLELRKYFGGSIALNPKVSYIPQGNIYVIEVPIYFLQNSEGGLSGGITAGWDTKNKKFAVSAFIGEILRIIP